QSQEKWENGNVAAFNSSSIGTEVIKLNYHVSFPGKDPFNEDNPGDPSSRALYYNISKTPVSRMDGDDGPNQTTVPNEPFGNWSQQQYDTRTLKLAQSEIVIRPATGSLPSDIRMNGKLSFYVDVAPVVDLPPSTILQIAIVEQKVLMSNL